MYTIKRCLDSLEGKKNASSEQHTVAKWLVLII